MSKRSERREAERLARKVAYQSLREQRAQSTEILCPQAAPPTDPERAIAPEIPVLAAEPNTRAAAATTSWAASFVSTLNQIAAEPERIPEPEVETLVEPDSTPNPISGNQLAANQANAQKSTGPITAQGKARSAQNSRSHGLSTSVVRFLHNESGIDYIQLADSIYAEHMPGTDTEQRLADTMIQSHWLMQRAIRLQQELIYEAELDTKKMNLFLRYQTTHERSYYRALRELKASQKERRQQADGFVSQTQKQAEARQAAIRLESLQAKTRLQNARARSLEVDAACRQVMEVPLPAHETLTFEELTKACSAAISTAALKKRHESEAFVTR